MPPGRLGPPTCRDWNRPDDIELEGRLQTRRWEDDHKIKHYRTEIVASNVEMLSGRRKKDYAAETAAEALETQAEVMGIDPTDADDYETAETDQATADEAVRSCGREEQEALRPPRLALERLRSR